jgi:hypothetical protein
MPAELLSRAIFSFDLTARGTHATVSEIENEIR